MTSNLDLVVDFLRKIGLDVIETPGAQGFVLGIRIVEGKLHIDPSCAPSALLHEAAHISIVPSRFRHYLNGNLQAGIRRMFDDIAAMNLDPQHPIVVAALQCSDHEATAWAYAAGLAAGLKPSEIILDSEYEGSGGEIRSMLQMSAYAGINGIACAGMCLRGRQVDVSRRYPAMTTWLQA